MNWLDTIYSDGSKAFVSNPTPKKGEEVSIRVRVDKNAPLKNVILRTKLNGIDVLLPMKRVNSFNNLDYYETKLTCYEDHLRYKFYFAANDKIYYYTQAGVTDFIQNDSKDFCIVYNYLQPDWVKNAVFYQIFPDRFCNGDSTNDVKDGEYIFDGHKTIHVKDFNSVPLDYEHTHCLDFYGGDLEGIKKQIPYLKSLGVTALYLNPILYGATVHRYDCLDFFMVDPHLGGDEALAELTKALHDNDMKIILDVSINHTGTANKWFNRDGDFFSKTEGAYNNPNALEREFYFFDENNNYKSWMGVPTLPTLNYTSQLLRDTIYRGKNSFIKKYLKAPFNIDGWRFDVADVMARNDYLQLHHDVWPEIRKAIKDENPNAYILAEDWSECSEFLNGNEWDATMNYFNCSRPIREFLEEGDLFNNRCELLRGEYHLTGKAFLNRLKEFLSIIPFSIAENQFNLIDSHDVPRLHNNKKIDALGIKLAIIFMFTMPGTPSIYYGDEIGIDGLTTTNEGCRYPMNFDALNQEKDIFKIYRRLAYLKKNELALANGGIKFFEGLDKAFAYARIYENEAIITVGSKDSLEVEYFLPIKSLGYEELPENDLFGKPLRYKKCEDGVILYLAPKESLLIKL